MTKQRELILQILNQSDRHLTADEVFFLAKLKMPSIAMATIYNNLNHLHAEGKIRKVTVEGHPDRYDRATRHDHLVCSKCGDLTDIILDDFTEQLQSQIRDSILSYDLQIRYICPACRKQTNQK